MLLAIVVLFFMFPIFWILLMSFQTNELILRMPPSIFFTPTFDNYIALVTGEMRTAAGSLQLNFMQNLWNSVLLSTASVAWRSCSACPRPMPSRASSSGWAKTSPSRFCLSALRRHCSCSCRLSLYFKSLGLTNTYIGLIWVYQLICLPLILWIVRGYFEDLSPDIEHAHRIAGYSWFQTFRKIAIPLALPGIAAAGLLAFIFAWNNFIFALVLASADKQPVTVGALAFVTASGIQYGQIAAAIVLSVIPTFVLAMFAQRYLGRRACRLEPSRDEPARLQQSFEVLRLLQDLREPGICRRKPARSS